MFLPLTIRLRLHEFRMPRRFSDAAARTIVEDLKGLPVFERDPADVRYPVLNAGDHLVLPSRQEHTGAGTHPAHGKGIHCSDAVIVASRDYGKRCAPELVG